MKKYKEILGPLKQSIIVSHEYMESIKAEIEQTARDIHKRYPTRTYEDQYQKCFIGSIIEHGIYNLLNTDEVWARLSKQATYEDRKFDIECIIRELFDLWSKASVKLDVKSGNKYCAGEYFAFNCFNKEMLKSDNEDTVKLYLNQYLRAGANLDFFINHSPETELLLIADRVTVEDGWRVVPKYLIHRDAFNCDFSVTGYNSSPYYYLRYSDMISKDLCVRI